MMLFVASMMMGWVDNLAIKYRMIFFDGRAQVQRLLCYC